MPLFGKLLFSYFKQIMNPLANFRRKWQAVQCPLQPEPLSYPFCSVENECRFTHFRIRIKTDTQSYFS